MEYMMRMYGLKNKKRYFPLIVAVLLLFQTSCATTAVHEGQAEENHWGYTGKTGPEYWHTLDPAYTAARDGKAQSPVNIITADLVPADTAEKLSFYYHTVYFKIENNGHTIEIAPSDYSNYIIIDDSKFILQQIHFHLPGEHTVDGKSFDMEAHLVHKNAEGAVAVVGILIAQGRENPALKETFGKLPKTITSEEDLMETPESFNPEDLLPAEKAMYRYDGSLTTPPCTEGVKWSVFARTIELSEAQINAFKAIYAGNSRPVQQLNDRKVYRAE
jgi:carbonic anhydrase